MRRHELGRPCASVRAAGISRVRTHVTGYVVSAFRRTVTLRTRKLLELLSRRPETGRELQRFFKVRPRLPAAALADEREPEIEEIAMIRAVARNRLAEGLFGFVEMSV